MYVFAPSVEADDRVLFVADRLAEVLALAALTVLAAVQELAGCCLRLGACRAALQLITVTAEPITVLFARQIIFLAFDF